MSLKTLSFLLALPLVAASCNTTAHEAPPPVLGYWQDVPVPRGFEPVETVAAKASLHVGEFRHGELRYEGIGSQESVEQYYLDRLPIHGWEMDLRSGAWRKGPSRLDLDVSLTDRKRYEGFQKVVITLRMRSERTPIRPQ